MVTPTPGPPTGGCRQPLHPKASRPGPLTIPRTTSQCGIPTCRFAQEESGTAAANGRIACRCVLPPCSPRPGRVGEGYERSCSLHTERPSRHQRLGTLALISHAERRQNVVASAHLPCDVSPTPKRRPTKARRGSHQGVRWRAAPRDAPRWGAVAHCVGRGSLNHRTVRALPGGRAAPNRRGSDPPCCRTWGPTRRARRASAQASSTNQLNVGTLQEHVTTRRGWLTQATDSTNHQDRQAEWVWPIESRSPGSSATAHRRVTGSSPVEELEAPGSPGPL